MCRRGLDAMKLDRRVMDFALRLTPSEALALRDDLAALRTSLRGLSVPGTILARAVTVRLEQCRARQFGALGNER